MTDYDVIETFAGPGGAGLGIHALGLRGFGLEWNKAACKTRRQAGLATRQVDVSKVDPAEYVGTPGQWHSPPCEGFSAAGLRKGHGDAGRILEHIQACVDAGGWVPITSEEGWEDARSALVLEPLRWALLGAPRWVAWEQVGFVQIIWDACKPVLEAAGFHVWTGLLQAEQYGVAQTRKRAILIASRDGEVGPPPPTHSKYHVRKPERLDEGVLPWISMADALGPDYQPERANDGDTAPLDWVHTRPSPTIVGSFAPEVVARPSWRGPGDPPRQKTPGSVRVTVDQAAVLQSFPVGHPWQGSEGEVRRQIGDAVPPLLATAVAREAARHSTTTSATAGVGSTPQGAPVPRGSRRAAAKPLSLGFAGSGELDPKTIIAMLDDLVGDTKPESFYVPVTMEDFTDEVEAVIKWAVDNEVPYTTISDEAAGKDKALKKIIDGAADDYDAGESAGKAIVELLAGDESEPVEDGRLLMFFDGDEDEDVAVFEEAHDLEVPAFDLRDGLSPMSFGDDETPAAEPDPEPEPEEAPSRRRGRRGAAAETESAQEPAAGAEPAEDRMELSKLSLVELKKRAKAADPEENTTESLRGLDKGQVIDIILGGEAEPEEPADEAQQTPTRRGRAKSTAATATEAVEPAGPGDEPADEGTEGETREEVFARLRGQRETAERIGAGLTLSAKKALELDDEGAEELEKVAGLLAGALMLFAEFLVIEVRKPKSAGRPRKDGTEAQPAANPRRRRAQKP